MKPSTNAESIFLAAVARVDPVPMIQQALRIDSVGRLVVLPGERDESTYDLADFDRIFVTGMGKASARMALGLENVLGSRLSGGIVAVKEGHLEELGRIRLIESSHPVPDGRSVEASRTVLELGASMGTTLNSRDLVIVLVSGGGSSLLCAPAPGISLDDKIAVTRLLLSCGATIHEMNCVRKHLSAVKGGQLATALAPATVLALVLSDVIGDELDTIASGPTVPDSTSFADALQIVRRYGIEDSLPASVALRLHCGAAGGEGAPCETPKPGDPVFEHSKTVLVGTNRLALEAANAEAQRLGYNTLVLSSRLTGEARELALTFLGIGQDIVASGFPLQAPACIIAGGETTVTLRGKGRGGRNQEMALAFLAALGRSGKASERLTFLSGGTDGNDGPTDAAGAVVNAGLYDSARSLGLDIDAALKANDSYTYFKKAGGLLMTGPTNTNVCDVQVLLVND